MSKSSTTTCPSVIPLDHLDLQPGQFNSPFDMSTDDEGMVYVTDWGNDRVQKFTLQGELVAQINGEIELSPMALLSMGTIFCM